MPTKMGSILDRKLARDLWSFRGQALGIVLVLACAAAAVSMSFSVQRSLDATREDYYRHHGFADLFAAVSPAPLSLVEAARRIPGVAAAAGRVVGYGAISIDGFDEPVTGRLVSLPEKDGPPVNALALRRGREPAPDRPDEVLVNEGFAKAHGLGLGSHLVLTIGGHRRTVTVAGIALSPEFIFTLGPGQIVPDDRRFGIVWMARAALAADLGLDGRVNDLAVRLGPGTDAGGVTETLVWLLASHDADIHDRSRQYSHAFVSSQLEELGAIGVLVPAIFLGVALFLLHASMRRIVEVQRAEVGIVRALGFDGRTIGWHYVKFALVLAGAATVLGLPVGIALGYGMTTIYAEFFHFPFLRYRPDILVSAGVAVVLGCASALAAWHPAARTAALPPAAVMRPAVPVTYRKIPGEHLLRCAQGFPAAMVLRQLARRPLRPLLTMLAVAFAMGLQIATLFSFDALDQMVDVFYARAQRQDATIAFATTLPDTVLADVSGWPGVGAVEGRLDMPARLAVAGTSRQVVVTGLPADGILRRLLDLSLAPVAVPADGIALSRRLAAILHARVGDRVTVSPAAGHPFELPVKAVVEQYVGMGAYMELDALGRLSGEGPVVSGADVKLVGDPSGFHRILRSAPFVAGYVPRAETVTAFRETMVRTLTIIVSAFVALAAVAAFAIVDATVRVALSERVRELAIMRALGFGEGMVVALLAGELGLAVLLALPVGAVIGPGLGQLIVWNLDNDLFQVPLVVGWRSYAIAGGTVLVAAILSCVLAARRLRDIDVPAALRLGAA
jgi:putative ABC transport system permease protein